MSCYAVLPPNASNKQIIRQQQWWGLSWKHSSMCVVLTRRGQQPHATCHMVRSCPHPTDHCLTWLPFVHSTCLVSFHLCIHVSCRSYQSLCPKSRHHLTRARLSIVSNHVNLLLPGFSHYYLLNIISFSMNDNFNIFLENNSFHSGL